MLLLTSCLNDGAVDCGSDDVESLAIGSTSVVPDASDALSLSLAF